MKKRILSFTMALVMLLGLMPSFTIHAHAAYEDGDECWNCGHYHWDEYMHECGACSPSCTNDWCALETHCHRCGGCLNGDYPCDECGLCKDCMAEIGHCSQCDMCWMDNGADDVLCGNCRRCEFCSPICPECGMCEDCAGDPSDGMHCPDCGSCYQVTEQCQFVENNHCKDCCIPCDQCGECVAGDALETCAYCGLCVECCEFNSMMEGCEDGSICVYNSSEWDEHVCGVCLNFFQETSDLCETCVLAGEYRCVECCEAASECSDYMCEYDDGYEDHFCVDCGECFHDVTICETCEGAGEYRCVECCAAIVSSMGCDCSDGWCFNDGEFEQHLTEIHEGGDDDHDCTPSNRWSFDETEHWRACRFCGDDTSEEVAEEHKEETAMPHKLDANGKCVTCGYVKGSKVSITRQPRSVSATVSIAVGDELNPYHVKNNTVTLRADAKVFNGKKDDLGYNWYARVTDQNGKEIFRGAVEEMRADDCFADEAKYDAICNGFDGPELTISVPYRACQWKYSFWCEIDLVNSKNEVLSTVKTDEVQIKAGHLYTVCENVKGSGADTKLTYKDAGGETHTTTIPPSDGHRWYCVGCKHTDPSIKTAKGKPVMHRYGTSVLRGESVTHPGAKVYGKQCQDCRYITYYETHQHVYYSADSKEEYNRGTFQVDEEKTTNMAHALVCLVEGCGRIKLETHEWDWRHGDHGSDEDGGGMFYRICRICEYPDYDYRPVDKDGNKIDWTTKNVLVTAVNAQPSRTLAVEGDRLTLTINNNSVTQGKRCTKWTVEYINPDGKLYDITAYYAFAQKENGEWSTTVKLAGCKTGGYLIFTPTMVDCTSHEYVTEGYVAPVCMYDGFEGYRICKYCHTADPADTRSDEERILKASSTKHTGTQKPLYQKEITLPSGKKTVTWTANKSESNGKRYNYVAGDCTTKGCEGDFLCTACERVIPGKREYIHSAELDWVGEVIATCGRDGYQGDGHCQKCGKFVRKGYVVPVGKDHIGPILDHGEEVAATCTTAGKTAPQWCLTCSAIVEGSHPTPALGHHWVKDEANSTEDTVAYKCDRTGCTAARYEKAAGVNEDALVARIEVTGLDIRIGSKLGEFVTGTATGGAWQLKDSVQIRILDKNGKELPAPKECRFRVSEFDSETGVYITDAGYTFSEGSYICLLTVETKNGFYENAGYVAVINGVSSEDSDTVLPEGGNYKDSTTGLPKPKAEIGWWPVLAEKYTSIAVTGAVTPEGGKSLDFYRRLGTRADDNGTYQLTLNGKLGHISLNPWKDIIVKPNGAAMVNKESFEAGATYTVMTYLSGFDVEDYKKVKSDTVCTVNGESAEFQVKDGQYYLVYDVTVPIPDGATAKIQKVELTVPAPVYGAAIGTAEIKKGSGCSMAAVNWFDPKGGSDFKYFGAGTAYTVQVMLEAAEKYGFTGSTVFTVNGNFATVKALGKEEVTLTYTFPATGTPGTVTPPEPGKPEEPKPPFTDIPKDSPYEDAIKWAAGEGITTGKTETLFDPYGTCTRGQAVTFLWRAAGKPAPKSAVMPFTDVKSGSYCYEAVLWAVEQGITKGTTDTTFSPDLKCSRGHIVTFLYRAAGSPAVTEADPFRDVAEGSFCHAAVLWAVEKGITKGVTASSFAPKADCTRAQIVTFLYRAQAK